ncbi:MAG: decarboxylating 6-phosphogluconate dehydrogenase [Candidatus Bathyarchaeota archaeon]|nr:MAG: decarboxylating 6-phosphogluconate dehydrogenase [Candidatus Bathyarchaeota archaeon]
MRIGYVGLGRMGLRMVSRILGNHQVVAYDINPDSVAQAEKLGAEPVSSLEGLAKKLQSPRVVWIMVPAGNPVESTVVGLEPHLGKGDILIDGGNSFYRDSARRAERLKGKGVHYIDVGTSGGLEGAEKGASLTIGGPEEAVEIITPLLESVARPDGFLHCGSSGAGHYVKMVHNGIEYAMLQALGEGFEMLESGPYDLDLGAVAGSWNNGCVIRSWMMELAERAFAADPALESLRGEVGGGETGRWMVETAMGMEVSTPVIALSLFMRFRSRQEDTFAGKVVAAIRREFGGHAVKEKE